MGVKETILYAGMLVAVVVALVSGVLAVSTSYDAFRTTPYKVATTTPLSPSPAANANKAKATAEAPKTQAPPITPNVTFSKNVVLLISTDGFRASYLQQNVTPAIQSLYDTGASAPYMYPSFPSVTFPNHYTIVTGLYPEVHGIVDNSMYDPTITPADEQYFSLGAPSSFNPEWWHGEPVWRTVQYNGGISATYFWPGSEVPIKDSNPNFFWHYDDDVPFSDRVDSIVQLMLLPESSRPEFFTLYFNQPDHYGHEYGPDSPQVTQAIIEVDSMIQRLLNELERLDIRQYVNIILVSDHGMQQVNHSDAASLILADYLNVKDNLFTSSGAIGRVQMQEGTNYTAEQLFDDLSCKLPGFNVYARDQTPRRLHYRRSDRIGEVLISPKAGFTVGKSSPITLEGEHGYDFRDDTMRAIFVANGPDIKTNGTQILPFENIEIYEFISDLLNLQFRAPNNGTRGLLWPLMNKPPPPVPQPQPLNVKCPNTPYPVDTCDITANGHCQNTCPSAQSSVVTSQLADASACLIDECNTLVGWHSDLAIPLFVQTTLYGSETWLGQSAIDCLLINETMGDDVCSTLKTDVTGLAKYHDISTVSLSAYSSSQFDAVGLDAAMINSSQMPVWSTLTSYVVQQAVNRSHLLVISGPVWDGNRDGVVDSDALIRNETFGLVPVPTDVYLIMVSCEGGYSPNKTCADAQVLSFVIPNVQPRDNTCIVGAAGLSESCAKDTWEYIFDNTARVRDIEELTGLQFFTDPTVFEPYKALQLRTQINLNLW